MYDINLFFLFHYDLIFCLLISWFIQQLLYKYCYIYNFMYTWLHLHFPLINVCSFSFCMLVYPYTVFWFCQQCNSKHQNKISKFINCFVLTDSCLIKLGAFLSQVFFFMCKQFFFSFLIFAYSDDILWEE